MTTAVCPGHRLQSMTASADMPNYCDHCKVWWGAPVLYVTTITTPPEVARRRDCGQDGVCATPPGCARHWEERNRELATETARLREEVARLQRERDGARADLAEEHRQHERAKAWAGELHAEAATLGTSLAAAMAERDALAVRVAVVQDALSHAANCLDAAGWTGSATNARAVLQARKETP